MDTVNLGHIFANTNIIMIQEIYGTRDTGTDIAKGGTMQRDNLDTIITDFRTEITTIDIQMTDRIGKDIKPVIPKDSTVILTAE
jgi:hypothetical protein